MVVKGYLRMNDNFVYYTLENDNDSYYFGWYSNFDYLLYETTDKKRIDEILAGMSKFAQNTYIYKNRQVVVEKMELL